MAAHSTPDVQATAVARVMAGESRRSVAADTGVSHGAVSRWVAAAERAETDREKKLAKTAATVAATLEQRQEAARGALLERIATLIPTEENLRDAVWSYGVLTDKVLLAAGRPTSIVESRDRMDAEIDRMLGEMAGTATNGHVPH